MADIEYQATVRNAKIRILEQAAQLKILPLDVETLHMYCFLDLKTDSEKAMLWRVFMLLLYQHDVTAKEVLNWCEAWELGDRAVRLLTLESAEGQWLAQRRLILGPSQRDVWVGPGSKFYECAKACFNSADIQGIGPDIEWRRLKQTCYIAFGIFLQMGPVDAEWVKDGIDIWYTFGFVTCETTQKKAQHKALAEAYSTAIWLHVRARNAKHPDLSVLFDQFFNHYITGNLISWLDPESELGFETKFPLLKEFLSEIMKPGPESVSGWSVWRLCHLKELRDQMEVPAVFNAAIDDYQLPNNEFGREQELRAYEKLWTYGGHKKLHLAQKRGRLSEHAKETSRKGRLFYITSFTECIYKSVDNNRANPAPNVGSEKRVLSIAEMAELDNPRSERRISKINDLLNPEPPTQSQSRR